MSKIVLYPFNEKYVWTSTVPKFRKWVKERHDAFRHDYNTARPNDRFIFSLRTGPAKWIMVGEATVTSNHTVGKEKESCPLCKENSPYDKDFLVHIQTVNYTEYQKDVDARDEAGIALRMFAIVSPDEYERLQEMI